MFVEFKNQRLFHVFKKQQTNVNVFGPLVFQNLWFFQSVATQKKASMFWTSDAPKPKVFVCFATKAQNNPCASTSDAQTPLVCHCFERTKQKSQCFWTSDAPKLMVFNVFQYKNKRITVVGPLMLQNQLVFQASAITKTKESMQLNLWSSKTNCCSRFCKI